MRNFIRKDIRLERIERLQSVQARIAELNRYITLPKLRDFYTSTTTRPADQNSAAEFVKEVMLGNKSPHVYSNKGACSYSESETFWSAMERYCHEMIEHCTNQEANNKELFHLKLEEKELKKCINIT